jgi:hypothetical protein
MMARRAEVKNPTKAAMAILGVLLLSTRVFATSPQPYALVDAAGNVVNIVVWDGAAGWPPPAGSTAVPAPDGVSIGWTYNGSACHAPAQPTPPALPNPTIIPSPDFINRFTPAEQLAVETAAQSNPALQLWPTKETAAQTIDLAGAEAKAGMDARVGAGLVSAARETEILKP